MSERGHPSFAAVLSDLYAPGLDPVSFRIRAAELLRRHVGCDIVSFASFDPKTRKLDIDFDPFVPGLQQALGGFARHMAKYPCFNFDPTVNEGRPFLRSDYLSDEEFRSAPVYLEGFARAGISDHAAILVPPAHPIVYFIGLEIRSGNFRSEQRDRMNEVQPHLANARHLAESLASLEHAVADPAVFVRAGIAPREAEVLMWLARGKSNSDIATLLDLKLSTVKGHVASLFNKLGVENRHSAILRAHQLAMATRTEPPPASRRVSAQASH